MLLDRDEIVEASLLEPADDGMIAPSTQKEKALLLREELEPQEAQEATTSPWKPRNPQTQRTT